MHQSVPYPAASVRISTHPLPHMRVALTYEYAVHALAKAGASSSAADPGAAVVPAFKQQVGYDPTCRDYEERHNPDDLDTLLRVILSWMRVANTQDNRPGGF